MEPQHRHYSLRGEVDLLSRKPAKSLKRGKIGPRLLMMINKKLHSRYRLVPISMAVDDLEWPFCVKFFFASMFGALKPGFRSLATLKVAVTVIGEL